MVNGRVWTDELFGFLTFLTVTLERETSVFAFCPRYPFKICIGFAGVVAVSHDPNLAVFTHR